MSMNDPGLSSSPILSKIDLKFQTITDSIFVISCAINLSCTFSSRLCKYGRLYLRRTSNNFIFLLLGMCSLNNIFLVFCNSLIFFFKTFFPCDSLLL
ncbi:hypothetical protein MT325_m108L [Paramecium bursaria chlorella virus MT325]|uniref:Uncharacterized protein m108L n=1 Tax=Paramecium bursaria Chlorella virus MT325 TaxID=346932 RepID=A7ITI8_PBCVM|nr:hypothetical protein MT325_m108L [Paramecium bursaria chlorella virus MT325]